MKVHPLLVYVRKLLQEIWQFLSRLISHCIEDQCTQVAGALTYTTTLALVPLLAVLFIIFSAFPIFDELLQQVQLLVFEAFAPGIRDDVQYYILEFTKQASKLTGISLVILLVSALLTLDTVNKSFNRIWHVKCARNTFTRILVYFLILVIGPVLVGLSLAITTYLFSLPYISDVVNHPYLHGFLLSLAPIIMTGLVFAFIYYWVPNTKIRWAHAWLGGFVAAVLFELAKQIFALYVSWFPTYQLLYGALAVIPLMLIWIYASWLIILIGAEVVYSLGNYPDNSRESRSTG